MLLRQLVLVGALGLASCTCVSWAADDEGKSGTLTGKVTEKGENWIRVQEEGKSQSERYTPRWTGGLPKDGGGLDKEMLQAFRNLKPGSYIRLEWAFEERPRAIKITVLKEGSPE